MKQNDEEKADISGQCGASEAIQNSTADAAVQNVKCQQTYSFIKTAKLGNTISQATQSIGVNMAGSVGAYKAQAAGTQAAVMSTTGNLQEYAGGIQTSIGIANAAAGAYQIMLSRQHSDKSIELKQAATAKSTSNDEQVASGIKNKNLYTKASREQTDVADEAMMNGVMSVVTGSTMALNGALQMAAGAQQKRLADTLANAQGSNYQLSGTSAASAVPTSGGTTAITPSGTDSSPATATGDLASKNVPSITPAVNPDNTNGGGGSGPAPGTFAQGNPSAAAGSNGAPVGAPGGLSAAKPDGDNPQAHLAESRQNTGYNSGAGSGYVAGNVAADKSADLGFLANLLPKPQEEMGKNGILDYGNRSPASAGPYSFLGKDVNIFKRISDRTTAKIKSGDIGI